MGNISNQEAVARKQRWAFLEGVAFNQNCRMIVTAHHKNDQVENFLLQVMRGLPIESTIMSKENEKNGFVRYKPFLDVEKNILINSAKRNNIPWIEDVTNLDTHHDRNYIRNVLIPSMMERRNVMKTIPMTIESIKKQNTYPSDECDTSLAFK